MPSSPRGSRLAEVGGTRSRGVTHDCQGAVVANHFPAHVRYRSSDGLQDEGNAYSAINFGRTVGRPIHDQHCLAVGASPADRDLVLNE